MSGSFFGGFSGGSSGSGGNPFQPSGTTNPFQTSSSSSTSRPPGSNAAAPTGTFAPKFGTGPFQTPQTTDRNPFQKPSSMQSSFAGSSTNTNGLNMNNEGRQMNATAAPFVPSSGMKNQPNPFASANPFGSHSLGDNSTTSGKSGVGFGSGAPPSFPLTHGHGGYGQLGGAGRGGISQDARQGQGFFQNKGNTSSGGNHMTTTDMTGRGGGMGPGYQRHQSPPQQSNIPGPGQGPLPGHVPGPRQGPGPGGMMSTGRLDQQRAERSTSLNNRGPRGAHHDAASASSSQVSPLPYLPHLSTPPIYLTYLPLNYPDLNINTTSPCPFTISILTQSIS